MARLHVEAEGVARAAPQAVWELIADAGTYSEWGPWSAGGYEDLGDQAADGAGVIRWFRYGRTTTVEKVLESEPARRLVYTVIKGIPVRNYRAEVTLSPEGDGTHIRWSASWGRTLRGRVVHRRLRALYLGIVSRLIAAAERRTAASPDVTGAASDGCDCGPPGSRGLAWLMETVAAGTPAPGRGHETESIAPGHAADGAAVRPV